MTGPWGSKQVVIRKVEPKLSHYSFKKKKKKSDFTSIGPPEGLCATRVFHHAEEAGQAVGETAEDGAVPGGGGAGPGGASPPTHGPLLKAPKAAVPGGGPIQSGRGA